MLLTAGGAQYACGGLVVDVVTQYDLYGLKRVFLPCGVAAEDMLQNSIPFSPVKLRMGLKQITTDFYFSFFFFSLAYGPGNPLIKHKSRVWIAVNLTFNACSKYFSSHLLLTGTVIIIIIIIF